MKGKVDRPISSFDIIGDVAIVRITLGASKKKRNDIVQYIIQQNKRVKVIFNRVGKTEGEERVPKLVRIYGRYRGFTLHKENGSSFAVDPKKMYFSPRMGSERLRVYNSIGAGADVLDMFCGVGPFSLELAKKARYVFCIDKNREAIKFLVKNIALNKLNNVHYKCGDAGRVAGSLKTSFDAIIMNFPTGSTKFVKTAVTAAKENATLYQYVFVDTKNGEREAFAKKLDETKSAIGDAATIRSVTFHKAGEVAPYLLRLCMQIIIHKTHGK